MSITEDRPSPMGPQAWFADMIDHCLEYAEASRAAGRPIVGILCEFTPRELIMAVEGVPVCLCGGSAKTIPAAEEDLPVNLCPLIKSTYGYHRLKTNPFLEMADLVVAETTCDGKKKMYEIMGQTRPMSILELPQKEDDADALEHWIKELHKFKRFLEARYQRMITDEKLRGAIHLMNRERALRRALAGLMKLEEPPFTGVQLLAFKSSISGLPTDLAQYEAALQHYASGSHSDLSHPTRNEAGGARGGGTSGHADFLRQPSVQQGAGSATVRGPRRVRILLTGVPIVHGAERVLELIEAQGGLVVCQENCTGLKPILEDVDEQAPDPIRALAEKYFHLPCSVKTPNTSRLNLLRQLALEYRAEGIIELVWQACLTYEVESFRVKQLAEQELRLPYLRIVTDYSPADSTRIAVRVEALLETIRARSTA